MNSIYRIVGLSKQGFHLKLKVKTHKEELNASLLNPDYAIQKMYFHKS